MNQIVAATGWSAIRGFNWWSVLLIALLYLVFGRALPQILADRISTRERLEKYFEIGRLGVTLISPLAWVEQKLTVTLGRIFGSEPTPEEAIGLEDELRLRLLESDDGVIGEIERRMIDGILSLEEMTVRDIMVPRIDVVALDRRATAREVMDTIVACGHSRLPVYQENLDRILGVLYVKDLLPFVIGNTNRLPLLDLIRPAYVIPESKRLPELFAELKRMRIHLAIVTDEYGGTAGLMTIEDILEEIVGEIQDEYDDEEELIVQIGDDIVDADGRVPLEGVEEALNLRFEEDEDFTTLGGFVHKHLGRLAVAGDTFEAEGVRVEIVAVERHRVRKMRVTKISPEEDVKPSEESEGWFHRLLSDNDDRPSEERSDIADEM